MKTPPQKTSPKRKRKAKKTKSTFGFKTLEKLPPKIEYLWEKGNDIWQYWPLDSIGILSKTKKTGKKHKKKTDMLANMKKNMPHFQLKFDQLTTPLQKWVSKTSQSLGNSFEKALDLPSKKDLKTIRRQLRDIESILERMDQNFSNSKASPESKSSSSKSEAQLAFSSPAKKATQRTTVKPRGLGRA